LGEALPVLKQRCTLMSDQLEDVITELDRLGLVEESLFDIGQGQTGANLYRDVRRYVQCLKRDIAKSLFYDSLVLGTATRANLIQYAIEYFHIVRMSPRMLAPSLSVQQSRCAEKILQSFLASEMYHDQLLLSSLQSVGITEKHLEHVMPLPSTFTMCTTLAVLAAQDPLSFKCCLFLYEETDDRFGQAFAKRANELGMPDAFVAPILEHAGVNDLESHADISRSLLAEIPWVSVEERIVAFKHVHVLTETLVRMEQDILDASANQNLISNREVNQHAIVGH
jgi:hypothetical protein